MSDSLEDLQERFAYRPPTGSQREFYHHLRESAKSAVTAIYLHTPVSREQSLAITKLEEAFFWANAAVARCS